jgi:hypothetical protein
MQARQRLNLTIRRMVVAQHRRTSAFARAYGRLRGSLELPRCAYTLLRPHRSLNRPESRGPRRCRPDQAPRPLTFRNLFLGA